MIIALRRNLGYKLLSVLIAILLYYVAFTQQNPRTSRDIYVRPEVIGLSASMAVKLPPEGSIITISGPSSALEMLRSQAIRATVDVSQAEEGSNRLPITYVFPPGMRSRVDIEGNMVTEVALVKKASRPFMPDVIHAGTPPIGYEYRDAITDPRQVAVMGLPSDVARVGRVVASVDNNADEGAIDRMVTLVAQDIGQKVMDSVTIDPPQVRVQIGLKRTLITKRVLLSAQMSGDPAPGFYIASYVFTPAMVTIAGPEETLAERSSLSVSVDVEGIAARTTKTVTIAPPPGVTLRDAPRAVRIRLDVRPIRSFGGPPTGTSREPQPPTPVPTAPAATETTPVTPGSGPATTPTP